LLLKKHLFSLQSRVAIIFNKKKLFKGNDFIIYLINDSKKL